MGFIPIRKVSEKTLFMRQALGGGSIGEKKTPFKVDTTVPVGSVLVSFDVDGKHEQFIVETKDVIPGAYAALLKTEGIPALLRRCHSAIAVHGPFDELHKELLEDLDNVLKEVQE